jgi:hypothetical protein
MKVFLTLVFTAAALACTLSFSGCSGELYIGTRRIDAYQETREMRPVSWGCVFSNCDKGALEK